MFTLGTLKWNTDVVIVNRALRIVLISKPVVNLIYHDITPPNFVWQLPLEDKKVGKRIDCLPTDNVHSIV